MNILELQKAKQELDLIVSDSISAIEDNRYNPSVREAGSAPTDEACVDVENYFIEAISKFKDVDFKKEYSFEEVIEEIINLKGDGMFPKNMASDIDCLKKMEQDTEYEDEKRIVINTVYRHHTDRYIMVQEWRSNDEYEETLDLEVREVSKKEKVSYEWS